MYYDLVAFGETMIRLSPPTPEIIEQCTCMNVCLAGSELNVAVAASRLGLKSAYISRLADNPLGKLIANKCAEQGVDTSWLSWSKEDRQGLYFFEQGVSPRPGMAYYDRADSAFCKLSEDEFRWDQILNGTKILHLSGITPALSRTCDEVAFIAVQRAKELCKLVSFDVNYRSKLWTCTQASKTLLKYLPYVDILFTSAGDADLVLKRNEEPGEDLAKAISEQYGIPTVCLIYAKPGSEALWDIVCHSRGKTYLARQRGELQTIDRLGAGDAFAAGFLTGFLEEGPQLGVEIGNALMMLKNTYQGDFCLATRSLVSDLLNGEVGMLKR